MQFGLIGYPLSHSFSYGYFGKKFADSGLSETHSYQNFPLANIAAFPALLKENPALRGLNVTIPYKEAVIPYLDELSPGAAAIGAVNTILFEDGRLIGYNTDVIGFRDSLEAFLARSGGPAAGALVLGTGGAAKAVAWVLEQMQVPYHYVSRRKSAGNLTYEELDEALLKRLDLIVNTTPLGMSPNVSTCPDIPYNALSSQHRLYDLVYNPEVTLFLEKGLKQGAAAENGLAMLHGQAEASWRIWTKS